MFHYHTNDNDLLSGHGCNASEVLYGFQLRQWIFPVSSGYLCEFPWWIIWLARVPFDKRQKELSSLTFLFFFFFFFFICGGFCHTLKWNSQGFTCVPHPNPPSHLPLHPLFKFLQLCSSRSYLRGHLKWAINFFYFMGSLKDTLQKSVVWQHRNGEILPFVPGRAERSFLCVFHLRKGSQKINSSW